MTSAFLTTKELLEKKYGKDGAKNRIYCTTDKSRGTLKTLADKEDYESFVIADDIGGRFSVLTALGLLPLAVSGADIDAVMEGAKDAYHAYQSEDLEQNDCYKYAALRNILRGLNGLLRFQGKFIQLHGLSCKNILKIFVKLVC